MRFSFVSWLGLCFSLTTVAPQIYAGNPVQRHFLQSSDSPQQEYLLSPMIIFTPFGPQEVGARFATELWNDGFLAALNDSVSAEGSVFIGRWDGHDGMSSYVSANMRWDFHLVPAWTVFASPGLAIRSYGSDDDTIFGPSLQLGGFWNIQPDLAVRADIEVEHFTPRVGIAFRY